MRALALVAFVGLGACVGEADFLIDDPDAATANGPDSTVSVIDAAVRDAAGTHDAALRDAAVRDVAVADAPRDAAPDVVVAIDMNVVDMNVADMTTVDVVAVPDMNVADMASVDVVIEPDLSVPDAAIEEDAETLNTPPIATPGSGMTNEDTPVEITLSGTDIDSDPLTFSVHAQPDHGSAMISGSTLTYSPDLNYHGVDSLQVVANDGTASSIPATITITVLSVTECGDSEITGSETCDDGNDDDDDGCDSSCQTEVASNCGNGDIEYLLGEICDDGNDDNGDGCSDACQLEATFVTVAPQKISGTLECSSAYSNSGRKVAVDGLGNIYIVMKCGTEQQPYVVVSTDLGATYSAPVELATEALGVSEVAIAAGPAGVAYVVAVAFFDDASKAVIARTTDFGATWSEWSELAPTADSEISLEAFNDDVFVGVGDGESETEAPLLIFHSDDRGETFTPHNPAISQVFFDVIYDDVQDTLFACTDDPSLKIKSSADFSATVEASGTPTFSSVFTPAGEVFYSDWTASNGVIFVAGMALGDSGDSTELRYVYDDALGIAHTLNGLPEFTRDMQRAISADPVGNVYVVTAMDTGAVRLDRLQRDLDGVPSDYVAFDSTPRTVTASGGYPGLTALPTSTGVAMIYTDGDFAVWATVQAYP